LGELAAAAFVDNALSFVGPSALRVRIGPDFCASVALLCTAEARLTTDFGTEWKMMSAVGEPQRGCRQSRE
jgi:hypothetical protein